MASSFFHDVCAPAMNGVLGPTRAFRFLSERCEMTYEIDLITFHAFYNLLTQQQLAWTEHTGPKHTLKIGVAPSGKGAVHRAADGYVSKRTRVAFRGASKAPEGDVISFLTELRILLHPSLQKHQNIVNLASFAWEGVDDLELVDHSTEIWPVLNIEFGDQGTMSSFLSQLALTQSLDIRQSICYDVACGLMALHKCSIVHGDVKPDNVLIFRSETPSGFTAKVCDFDLSLIISPMDDTVHLPGGTRFWAAPEASGPMTATNVFKTDVYSFGLVVWNAFTHDGRLSDHISDSTSAQSGYSHMQNNLAMKACSAIDAIFLKLKVKGSVRPSTELHTKLHQVFTSTLGLDPDSRLLQEAVDALAPTRKLHPASEKLENFEWWAPLYYRPMQLLYCHWKLRTLKGTRYFDSLGSLGVARASISICKHIWFTRQSQTLVTLADAAVFLFRAYLEGYGVPDSSRNINTALSWLKKALEMEIKNDGPVAPWVMEAGFIYAQMGRPMPNLPGLQELIHRSLVDQLSQLFFPLKRMQQIASLHGIAFTPIFNTFRQQGLLASYSIEEYVKRTLLNTEQEHTVAVLPNPAQRLTPNGLTLIHFAASCGNLNLLRQLDEAFNIDLNIEDDYGVRPVLLAVHYSHLDVLEWLFSRQLDQKSFLGQLIAPLAAFVNFQDYESDSVAALFGQDADLAEGGAMLYHPTRITALALAVLCRNSTIVRSMLKMGPSLELCKGALEWAAGTCQPEIFNVIEEHLKEQFEYEPNAEELSSLLGLLVQLGPFGRLCIGTKNEFCGFVNEFVARIGRSGRQLTSPQLYWWYERALSLGDIEAVEIIMSQPNFRNLAERNFSHTEVITGHFGCLEMAISHDQKQVFDRLLIQGYDVQVKQYDGYYPTLYHRVASRELANGPDFIETIADSGADITLRAGRAHSYCSALEIAVTYGNMQVADALIRRGAQLDYANEPQSSPLKTLVDNKIAKAVPRIEFLLNHPIRTPNFILDQEMKLSILHRAAGPVFYNTTSWQNDASLLEGPRAILKALLLHYSDRKYVNAKTTYGATPLHMACFMGCDWAVELLLAAGADPTARLCLGYCPLDLTINSRLLPARFLTRFLGQFDGKAQHYGIVSRAGRDRCAELLSDYVEVCLSTLPSARDILLASWGLVDLSKEDGADYESWGWEKNSRVARFLVARRKKRASSTKS